MNLYITPEATPQSPGVLAAAWNTGALVGRQSLRIAQATPVFGRAFQSVFSRGDKLAVERMTGTLFDAMRRLHDVRELVTDPAGRAILDQQQLLANEGLHRTQDGDLETGADVIAKLAVGRQILLDTVLPPPTDGKQ